MIIEDQFDENTTMKKIKILGEDLKFSTVPIQQLDEVFVFQLIKTNRMSVQDFAHWLEAVRDEFFLMGVEIGKSQVK